MEVVPGNVHVFSGGGGSPRRLLAAPRASVRPGHPAIWDFVRRRRQRGDDLSRRVHDGDGGGRRGIPDNIGGAALLLWDRQEAGKTVHGGRRHNRNIHGVRRPLPDKGLLLIAGTRTGRYQRFLTTILFAVLLPAPLLP